MSCRNPRRGIAVLIVLAILSITMAICYAMMRTEFTNAEIQSNYQHRADARLAAYTGISLAIQAMQSSDWAGVDRPLVRNLGDGQSCTVTFQTGDASLSPTDPQYQEYPYRVTLHSVGSVTDPRTSVVTSTHTVESVVQFVRRKLSDTPANWSSLTNYTIYQWGTDAEDSIDLDLPVRIEGPIYAQNRIELAKTYPGDGDDVPFAGQIDEVVVFGKALSDTQIQNLANRVISIENLTATSSLDPVAHWRFDESANTYIARDALGSHDGLFLGTKPGSSAAPFVGGSRSALFDGFNDHVHLDSVPLTGHEMTILAWIKPSKLNDNGRIISKATGTNEGDHAWMLGIGQSGSNYRLRFRIKTNVSDTDTLVASSGNLSEDTWVFAAAVYNGITMRLFKDGVQVGSRFKFGNLPNTNTQHVSIGNNPTGSPRAQFLRDLNTIRNAGGADNRPVTGPIVAPSERTSEKVRSLFTDELNVAWTSATASSNIPLSHPGQVITYRLYPGGKLYNAQILNSTLRNTSVHPDPVNNPLGVCYRSGNLQMFENVNIEGILIVNGTTSDPDLDVYGQNVVCSPVSLPPLSGASERLQLPVAIVKDDLRVHDRATGSMTGIIATWDECAFQSGSQSAAFTMSGSLIVNQFSAQPRTEWSVTNSIWKDRAYSFLSQLANTTPVLYFPTWLQTNHSLNITPTLVIKPDSTDPTYHWPDWSQPIFSAHPDDGGLRWTVLDIREVSN